MTITYLGMILRILCILFPHIIRLLYSYYCFNNSSFHHRILLHSRSTSRINIIIVVIVILQSIIFPNTVIVDTAVAAFGIIQQQQHIQTKQHKHHYRNFFPKRESFLVPSARYLTTSTTTEATTKTMNHNNHMKLVNGIYNISYEYDIYLLDMWGVMHDGTVPYKGVINTVKQLYESNKILIILSNSSKRKHHTITMLKKLGFTANWFHSIITSGEVAYQMLIQQHSTSPNNTSIEDSLLNGNWYQPWIGFQFNNINDNANENNKKKKAFILGSGDDDIEYCYEAGWDVTGTLSDASIIITRGTFTIITSSSSSSNNNNVKDDKHEPLFSIIDKNLDPIIYETTLQQVLNEAAILCIPMLICNPDKIRPDKDRSPMPGMIGEMYEQALRKVHPNLSTSLDNIIKYIGKPFKDVYEIALQQAYSTWIHQNKYDKTNDDCPNIDNVRSRVCMVGDALETDITGGTKYNLSTIWILKDGVYQNEFYNHSNDEIYSTNEFIINTANHILDSFNDMNMISNKNTTTTKATSSTEVEEGTIDTERIQTTTTYAKGMKLNPTYIIPHFRW